MSRLLFLVLLIANICPVLLAGNKADPEDSASLVSAAKIVDNSARIGNIRLLGEEGGTSPGIQDNPAEIKAIPQRRELRCFLIGPLASMATSERYAKYMEDAGLNLSRHWREVNVGSDFWLYLPQLPSTRATTRILQELKANNIEAFIFPEGELSGAIALAVFTDKGAAERKISEFTELGYETKLYEMSRLAREYWLMSEAIPRPVIMEDLMNSEDGTEIPQKISRMDCKTVASAMQFQ